jgi:chromosome segregation ATPase
MFSIKKYLIIATAVAAAGFALWQYYTYTQNQIRIYAENAAKSEMAQKATQAALDKTQADLKRIKIEFDKANTKFKAADNRVRNLENKLAKHELDFLAARRPKDVQKIIDKASDNMLRCLEIVGGSPLTEDEINATKPSQINNECSDIANPNYKP